MRVKKEERGMRGDKGKELVTYEKEEKRGLMRGTERKSKREIRRMRGRKRRERK